MKRYRMRATLKGGVTPNAETYPHPEGAWVLFTDHQAEVERLRAAIGEAVNEINACNRATIANVHAENREARTIMARMIRHVRDPLRRARAATEGESNG